MKALPRNDHKIWGENYVALNPFYFGYLRLKNCLKSLENTKGKILEIGCGAGAFVRGVKKYRDDLDIYGSDIDNKAIEIAQKTDKKNKYITADVQNLPFKNNQFNAVIGFDIVEHVNNPQLSINEVYRILKKEGVFHVSIPLEASLFTIHGIMRKIGFIPKKIYADHKQQYTSKEIYNLLKTAGFTNIRHVYSGHFIQQMADFVYFSLLFITRKKISYTVEGYIDGMEKNLLSLLIILFRNTLSFIFYLESILLSKVPGLIGHYTAYKR